MRQTLSLSVLLIVMLLIGSCASDSTDSSNNAATTSQASKQEKKRKQLTPKQKELKLAEQMKSNPNKFQTAIKRAIAKDPMLIFYNFNLSEEQKVNIQNTLEKHKLSAMVQNEGYKKTPAFQKLKQDVEKQLTGKQLGLWDKLLEKM